MLAAALALALQDPVAPGPHWEAWPEADRLFRGDARWVGADGAYSIELGGERVLWLFADTVIDPSAHGSRQGADVTMIGNSLGLQRGRDPSRASISFHWRRDEGGAPRAFFPDEGGERFWPGDGLRLGEHVLVFLMRVTPVEGGLGFEVRNWAAVSIANPEAEPDDWALARLDTPPVERGLIVGSAGVLAWNGHVHLVVPSASGLLRRSKR